MVPRFPARSLPSTACLFACLVVPANAANAQAGLASPHVRSDDPALVQVIQEGVARSQTFRAIVDQIDRLPGLVYLVSSRCGAKSMLRACLDHNVRARGDYRFLRVNITPNESGSRLIALVAHELQHAVEVLSDDSATSQDGVTGLYERIARKRTRAGVFETDAALATQTAVMRELRKCGGKRAVKTCMPRVSRPPDRGSMIAHATDSRRTENTR
jgi:hypothetical protein